jgi:hypothetical protein
VATSSSFLVENSITGHMKIICYLWNINGKKSFPTLNVYIKGKSHKLFFLCSYVSRTVSKIKMETEGFREREKDISSKRKKCNTQLEAGMYQRKSP